MKSQAPGQQLRQAVLIERPLQIVGVINAMCAMLAQSAGFRALYISGAGVANAAFGLPDLGMTTVTELCEEVRRITDLTSLPVLVDADTGFGNALNIQRTVALLEKAGAAGLHLEDQVEAKRCGHRPGKQLVSAASMVDRIKAAVDARSDDSFVIMARSDALAGEGIEATTERMLQYVAAGADMIFAEAVTSLQQYQHFATQVKVPILANMTEFGVSPLFSLNELKDYGVQMVLYPLTAFRMMNQAAKQTYQTLRAQGSQRMLIDQMQTREELYQLINYYHYEQKLNELTSQGEDS